ncbi:hypothetical protein C8R45DRAFT_938717 [Mycena sanguinolenta]|nr:hypothetical protein C8R45DRAFT_938717 [Mycena sanguinolenta]
MTAGEQIRRVERARKAIYAGWYNDPALPETWSTDWDKWETSYFWVERAKDSKLKIDKLFKETWKLPGTIEPLAFMPGSCGEYFLFTADGRYYFYADRQLTVHDMEFGSAEEFLKYLTAKDAAPGSRLPKEKVPREPGTDLRWCLPTLTYVLNPNNQRGGFTRSSIFDIVPVLLTSVPDIAGFVAYVLTTVPPSELENSIFRLEGDRLSLNDLATQLNATVEHVDSIDGAAGPFRTYLLEILDRGAGNTGWDEANKTEGSGINAAGSSNALWPGHHWRTAKEVLNI